MVYGIAFIANDPLCVTYSCEYITIYAAELKLIIIIIIDAMLHIVLLPKRKIHCSTNVQECVCVNVCKFQCLNVWKQNNVPDKNPQ